MAVKRLYNRLRHWWKNSRGTEPFRCALLDHKLVQEKISFKQCSRVSLFKKKRCPTRLFLKVRLERLTFSPEGGSISLGYKVEK